MTSEGFGTVTMWGFSPAIDIQSDVSPLFKRASKSEEVTSNGEKMEVLNVLMLGAGDCRHILKTMALRKRHKNRKIHIHVVENNLELLGKHLLLLTLALEPAHRMGLQEKVELFAELFGNSLIRQQSVQYLQEKAKLFVEMITDLDYADERMPTIDLSQLKYKERDYLEGIFKFWKEPDPRYFMIPAMWDARVRQHLSTRYDSRKGTFDWDLSMKLHDLGATMICKQEYNRWRENGVAFEGREGIFDRPNKSMASGVMLKRNDGQRVPRRGYWGDIVTGPFIAFGVDTEEKSLLKTANGKPTKSSEDITLHNLTAFFHELQTGKKYVPHQEKNPSNSVSEARIVELDDIKEEEKDSENLGVMSGSKVGANREFYAPICCEEICVHFLPLNSLPDLPRKSKFQKLFDYAFISASMVQSLTPALEKVFSDNAILTIELVKFILDLNESQVDGFSSKVANMASEAGFSPFDVERDTPSSVKGCFARFIKKCSE